MFNRLSEILGHGLKNKNFVVKQYKCRVCNEIHEIKLDKNIIEGKVKFPFPLVFLHGELKNILTTLYIDKDLEIRGSDTNELKSEDGLFSKDQVIEITQELMKEIERLTEENLRLYEEMAKVKKSYNI